MMHRCTAKQWWWWWGGWAALIAGGAGMQEQRHGGGRILRRGHLPASPVGVVARCGKGGSTNKTPPTRTTFPSKDCKTTLPILSHPALVTSPHVSPQPLLNRPRSLFASDPRLHAQTPADGLWCCHMCHCLQGVHSACSSCVVMRPARERTSRAPADWCAGDKTLAGGRHCRGRSHRRGSPESRHRRQISHTQIDHRHTRSRAHSRARPCARGRLRRAWRVDRARVAGICAAAGHELRRGRLAHAAAGPAQGEVLSFTSFTSTHLVRLPQTISPARSGDDDHLAAVPGLHRGPGQPGPVCARVPGHQLQLHRG